MKEIPAKPVTDSFAGLLLLDKPAGVTSYDCVHMIKRQLQVERAGHCGTLDPSARGLLIVLLGKATRLQDNFHAMEKEYRFRAQFGVKTDTGDRDGKVIQTFDYAHITPTDVEKTTARFTGALQQTPPRYSALKYKGKPYHLYARKGIEIPRVPRTVNVHSFLMTHCELPYWEATVICSRGTYIRTLVEDVGEALGSGANLVELSRERIGEYRRSDALRWADLRAGTVEGLRAQVRSVSMESGVLRA